MKKLLVVFLFLTCLAGCAKEESIVCKIEQENVKIVNTIVYKEDNVIRQTLVNELSFESLGFTKDEILGLGDGYKKAYDVDGVEYTFEVKEKVLVETVKIDYDKADIETLIDLGLIQSEEKVEFVSLEKTVKTLESTGFKCE